jgi:hypothetical protein
MKKLLITAAVFVFATSAFATDLPSKKKAPLPTVATVETSSSSDSLNVSYGQDFAKNFGSKSDDLYQLTYTHNLGNGFTVGGMGQTTQVPGALLNQNLEAQAGYALPSFSNVTLSGKVGVGERFGTSNFPYFALYGNADYKLNDKFTVNALQYTYTSAFNGSHDGYQSHQLGTGITYNINSKYSLNATVARSFDTTTSFNTTGDQIMVGLTTNF